MDDHEVCRKHIQNLEAKLDAVTEQRDEAYELLGERDLDDQEKDELIAGLVRDVKRLHADREVSIVETTFPEEEVA